MHRFVRGLITEWRRLELPFSDKTIIAAVSGGADSVAMFLALADLRRREKLTNHLIVAHFDHGLRGKESSSDVRFVGRLAEDLGFAFVTAKGSIKKRGNLEQNARRARYDFLLNMARSANAFAILTAHTINDQAETFLLNLIRGSGPSGLSAMPPVRTFENESILLVRPLLRWALREDTESFCRDAGCDFRTDAMNTDPAFSRVRIRRELIPALKKYNPRIVETLAKTAGLIAPSVNPPIVGLPDGIDVSRPALALSTLRQLSKHELKATLRLWLKANRGDLRGVSLRHIEAIEQLILSTKSGRIAELPGNVAVRRSSGSLIYVPK
ncbi:MAG TPA: tRNA lysidine(34) synthetase TilS [Pyrinomonadaceae bacterium]|nr:tRNA lysidine(34) synthetase TilS [Pyrinomonadaceae bacterium]HMP65506.1 tRNA lysidine(34) synthetase TilS [Pyrinomonadaceae bacterium]